MKRTNNFSFLHGFCKADCLIISAPPAVVTDDNSELNRLLKIVFQSDDNGVIQGDINAVMNSKTPPEVVTFIKQVLQQDLSSYRQPPIPDGMSDDMAESLAPVLGESKTQYAERVRSIIYDARYELEHAGDNSDDHK